MIEGICPSCGKKYYGWALLEGYHTCGLCGSQLQINNVPASDKKRAKAWLDVEHSLDDMHASQN